MTFHALRLPAIALVSLLSLAACGQSASPAASNARLSAAYTRLPDPSCVTQSGAQWAPDSISVDRLNTPTASNTNVSFTVASGSVSARVVAPVGVSVTPTTMMAVASGLRPVTVTVSPANAPGRYTVLLYIRSSTQASSCPEAVETLVVNAY